MLHIKTSKALVLTAGALAAGIAVAPLAAAEPCQSTGAATVCESNGSSSITAVPQDTSGGLGALGVGNQNGAYGPSGDVPPFGR